MQADNNQHIENVRENVDLIHLSDKEVYLVGTAHISQKSVDLAKELIYEIHPDNVAIEICQKRYESLKDPDRWRNTDIVKVIKEGKMYVLIAQLMLASFQKKLGDKLKIKPGTEMISSANVAQELGIPITLADREIRITLKRVWASLGFWTMIKTCFSMLIGVAKDQDIKEEDIEKLKSQGSLDDAILEFSKEFPEIKKSLIDERDIYLAQKIKEAQGEKIVAVVGAGHTPGIKKHIFEDNDLAKLEEVPPPGLFVKFLKYGIPFLIILMIILGFFKSGDIGASKDMVRQWIIIKGITGGLGALISLAHPITILVAIICAPFTALNPTISVGIVAGLTEAWLKKPTIKDFETVADDLTTLKGWWKNRLSKILLVACITNLVSSVGTFFALYVISSIFKNMF